MPEAECYGKMDYKETVEKTMSALSSEFLNRLLFTNRAWECPKVKDFMLAFQ